MTARGWGYRLSLIVLTLILLIPQLSRINHFRLIPNFLPGLAKGGPESSAFSFAPFWQGKRVRLRANPASSARNGATGQVLEFIDPETDRQVGDSVHLPEGEYKAFVLDERLFLISHSPPQGSDRASYEFTNGQLHRIDFWSSSSEAPILVEGKLFQIQFQPESNRFVASTVEAGKWTTPREVRMPPHYDGPAPYTEPLVSNSQASTLFIVNEMQSNHVFVRSHGKLFYHPGLTMQSPTDPNEWITYGADEERSTALVNDDPPWMAVDNASSQSPLTDHAYGATMDGIPIAMLVENIESPHPVGRLYQYDLLGSWTEGQQIEFPIGSRQFRLFSVGRNSFPYIVATTLTGTGFVYRWEPEEIFEVPGQGYPLTSALLNRRLSAHFSEVGLVLGLGLLPCLLIGVLTDLLTSAKYSPEAHLAPTSLRSIARIIDLALMGIITGIICVALLRNLNWLEMDEWRLSGMDHPDLPQLKLAIGTISLTILVSMITLVIVQGIWGLTPGKWICGLRTVRMNLQPCGIGRSLFRELLLLVDSTMLLWWIPGLLVIGLTCHRQRLGDLLSGTIVVRSRSMPTGSPPRFR